MSRDVPRHGPDEEGGHDSVAGEVPVVAGAPVAGDAPPYGGGLLPAFVARLREAGLDPDVEQLCDALWLARWTRGPDAPDDGSGGAAPPLPADPAQEGRPGGRPVRPEAGAT